MNLAPISVRGSVQSLVVHRQGTSGTSELATTTVGNVALDSFIWHPWFAKVSTDLSVGYDFSTGDADTQSALRASGTVGLDILPQSNYPVSLNVGHIESRISGDFVAADFTRDFASVRARAVLMPGLKSGVQASWDRTNRPDSGVRTGLRANINLDKTFNEDTVFLGIKSIGFQTDLRRSNFVATDPAEDDSHFDTARVRLSLRSEPSDDLVIDSRFSGSLIDFADDDDDERRLIAQGLTTLQWRPDAYPFTVTGALRTLWEDVSQEDSGGRTLERNTTLVSANLGLRWPVSNNLALSFGARASYEDVTRDEGIDIETDNDETGARFEGGFLAGASYISDKHTVGGFIWRWNAQFQTNNGIDSEAGIDSRDLVQLRHQIERRFDEIFFWPVRLTVTQGLDLRLDTEDDDGLFSGGITHSAALAYNRTDRASTGFGRLLISGSRNVIGETREFQSIQFRLGERVALDRDSRISGNLNGRASRSVNSEGDIDTSTSLSAEIRYEQRDIFEVDGLFFRSTFRANIFDVGALFGASEESTASFDTLNNDWRNILTYRIGQLSAEAEASAFHRDGGLGYMVMFRIHRAFGGSL